jgi:hypothetical protein
MSVRSSALYLVAFGILSSWACANAQDVKGEPKAIAYIYRKKEFSTRTWRPSVYVDEGELGRSQNGRYLVAKLSPGKHTFRSELAQEAIQIDLKGGECYYFRTEIASGVWKAHGRLLSVTPEQGRSDLVQLQPIDLGNVRDRTSVLNDEQLSGVRAACASKGRDELPSSISPALPNEGTEPDRP